MPCPWSLLLLPILNIMLIQKQSSLRSIKINSETQSFPQSKCTCRLKAQLKKLTCFSMKSSLDWTKTNKSMIMLEELMSVLAIEFWTTSTTPSITMRLKLLQMPKWEMITRTLSLRQKMMSGKRSKTSKPTRRLLHLNKLIETVSTMFGSERMESMMKQLLLLMKQPNLSNIWVLELHSLNWNQDLKQFKKDFKKMKLTEHYSK